MNNNTAQNKQLIENFLHEASRGKIEQIAQYLADDLVWTVPFDPAHAPFGGTLTKEQLLQQFSGLNQMMPNGLHYAVKNLTAEDNRVACEAEGTADSVMGPFSNRYHFLFELRDGKISAVKEYCDSAFIAAFAARATAAH